MRYSSPNRAAVALLPPADPRQPGHLPAARRVERLELIRDLGEATVLYDRLWTEVKTAAEAAEVTPAAAN